MPNHSVRPAEGLSVSASLVQQEKSVTVINLHNTPFCRTVERTISEHALLQPFQTVVVGVSGGVDSMALLDYLVSRKDLALRLIVAHLNHDLRGEESDGDDSFVRDSAERYGLRFESARVDVRALALNKRLSLEEAGREARYSFFVEVAHRCGADRVALAHHADDQAETVLMRLLRGSGPGGLRGMLPCSPDGMYVRPFLHVCRHEIEEYAENRSLSFRTDSSNLDNTFLRNRIRNRLLPILREYNPAIANRLTDTASIMAADEEVLSELVQSRWANVGHLNNGRALLDRDLLCSETAGLRLRLYRYAIFLVTGSLRRISFRHLEAIDRLAVKGPPNGSLNLPGEVRAVRSYGELTFSSGDSESVPDGFDLSVASPGSYDLPSGGRIVLYQDDRSSLSAGGGVLEMAVDLAQYPFPWTVRSYRPGDRMIPAGMTGHRKVKDLFIDEKIPRAQRSRIPLFFSSDILFWVAGLRKAGFRSPEAQNVIMIRLELLEFNVDAAILA